MRRKDTEITLKRHISGALSVAVIVSQLVSGGMTVFAAEVGDTITFSPGTIADAFTGNFTAIQAVTDGNVDAELPGYQDAFGAAAPGGFSFSWVDGEASYTTATKYSEVTTTSNAATLVATLTGDPVTINYELDGGDWPNEPNNPERKTYGTALETAISVPSKVGYSFGGWNLDEDSEREIGAEDDAEAQSDAIDAAYAANEYLGPVTLTAVWDAFAINVILDGDQTTKGYGTNLITEEPDPIAGKTFLGWTIGTAEEIILLEDINDAIDAAYLELEDSSDDIIVKSSFADNKYTITYIKYTGSGTAQAADSDKPYTAGLSKYKGTRDGYVFIGWSAGSGALISDGAAISSIDEELWDVDGLYYTLELTEVWEDADLYAAGVALDAAIDATEEAGIAAEKADEATKAVEKNATADTIKAAKAAAEAATAAAKKATDAAKAATDAAKAESLSGYGELKEELVAAAKDATDAAAKATASAKKATDAATAAQKKIDDAKAAEEAAKKSDGSTKDAVAPKGNALKDASGNATGFVVTSDDAKNPEVQYVGTDADKTAKDVKIADTAVDQNGHVYKVTTIADGALQNATGKTLSIGKNIKKIGKNACKGAKFKSITIKTDKKGKVTIGKGAFKVKNKKCVIKVKGAKGKNKTKLVKKIKKQATKGVTVK